MPGLQPTKKTAGASGLDSVIELVPRREEKVARQKKKKSFSGSSKNLLFGTKIADLEWSRLHPAFFQVALSHYRDCMERGRGIFTFLPQKKRREGATRYIPPEERREKRPTFPFPPAGGDVYLSLDMMTPHFPRGNETFKEGGGKKTKGAGVFSACERGTENFPYTRRGRMLKRDT